MTKARLIRIVCLGCRGVGKLGWLTGDCPRCEGAGKVSVGKALKMADERHALAGGGLVSGDYDCVTAERLRNEAAAIYAIAGITPPWLGDAR